MSNQELLAKIGQTTEETEFYTPMPAGYRKGHHKYVIVTGTVMSGLGKGIFSSSLAKLLQDKALKVAPIKREGYLNIDSGTLNPYRHGEVFVLDDGMETDMDLGTYERLLDQDLSAANFTTNGQIMSAVLKKEREGSYLGRDVQFIPHVTGEVKLKLREKISMYTNVPMKRVVTMHDVESIYTIPEALRTVGIDREVLTLLNLHDRVDQKIEDQARLNWRWFVDRIGKAQKDVTVAVTG